MQLRQVKELLNAIVLCGEDKLDEEVVSACGSDFMSDVLAYVQEPGTCCSPAWSTRRWCAPQR